MLKPNRQESARHVDEKRIGETNRHKLRASVGLHRLHQPWSTLTPNLRGCCTGKKWYGLKNRIGEQVNESKRFIQMVRPTPKRKGMALGWSG